MSEDLNIESCTTPTNLVSNLKRELSEIEADSLEIDRIISELFDICYALDHSSIVAITDKKGIIRSVNETFCKISKYSREELVGQNHRILKSGHHSDQFYRHMWQTIQKGEVWEGEVKNRAKDGSFYWVKTSIFPFFDESGAPYKYVSVRTNITEGKLYENRARNLLKNDFSQVMQSLDNFVFKLKKSKLNKLSFTLIAGKLAKELGLHSKTDLNVPIEEVLPEKMLKTLLKPVEDTFNGATRKVELTFETKQLFITLSPSFRDEVIDEIVGSVSDITDLKNSEKVVQHMAYHDSLTDLPNRRMLDKDLSIRVLESEEERKNVGILFIDLDHFKHINDTLGHHVGDYILIMAAHRLQKINLTNYINQYHLYHLGGDEFVFIMYDFEEKNVIHACKYLLKAFESPFLYKQADIHLKISIGVSFYPSSGATPEDLVKNADIALFSAKENGRNTYLLYTNEMNEALVKKLHIENDLRKALTSEDQLELYYQPQLDLHMNQIVGVEALIRWYHPEKGFIPPLDFIQIAEDTGLIIPLGEWVLKRACRQLKSWQDEGFENMKVSVNIATKHFQHPGFTKDVAGILKDADLSPDFLELEITENSLLDITEDTIETLTGIRDLGIQIAIDDFGTGYSSLSYLRKFPISTLKIDQTFVYELPENNEDRAIVSSIINLAHNLGLKVVAEGVERNEALLYLTEENCDQIQGYYFSRPLAAEDLKHLLYNHSTTSQI